LADTDGLGLGAVVAAGELAYGVEELDVAEVAVELELLLLQAATPAQSAHTSTTSRTYIRERIRSPYLDD
jgi:hypothetical protein